MPAIVHETTLAAGPAALRQTLTTERGLASFWTDQVDAEPTVGTVAHFGFGPNREMVFDMRIDAIDDEHVEWTCVGGPDEWMGTTVRWSYRPAEDGATLRFEHRGWAREDGGLGSVSYTWALIVERLARCLRDGANDPYFARSA